MTQRNKSNRAIYCSNGNLKSCIPRQYAKNQYPELSYQNKKALSQSYSRNFISLLMFPFILTTLTRKKRLRIRNMNIFWDCRNLKCIKLSEIIIQNLVYRKCETHIKNYHYCSCIASTIFSYSIEKAFFEPISRHFVK